MPLADGDVFAGFVIQRLLGSGGMGEVYLAQHPRLPRMDALKILPAALTDDADFRQRFDREANLAATLWHPHIVGLHDRGEFDGQLWITMDFVDGTDAARALQDNPGGMPEQDVLEIVTAVADALDYAHQRSLLHRDVKPANILLTRPDADRRRILLTDFGIARNADEISGLTATNVTIGSISYAAPEQLMGESIDGRADQYALAATAFHLLAGSPPFEHSNAAVVIGKHLTAPAPQLSGLRADLARLDPVLTKAMAKDPAQRYPRCLEFAQELGKALAGPGEQQPATQAAVPLPSEFAPVEPTQAALPGPAWPAPDWPAPAWPAPGPAVPGPHPGGPGFPGPPMPYPAIPPPTRRRWPAIVVPLVLLVLLVGAIGFAAVQVQRPRPTAAAPTWQPYVDYAKQFTVWLTDVSAATVDHDIQQVLDGSTGEFRDNFLRQSGPFKDAVMTGHTSSRGTIKSAALESISGPTAQVLIAAAVATTRDGSPDEPRSWRLKIRIEKVGNGFKAAKVEFLL